MEFDQFDDELRTMEELLEEDEIALTDKSLESRIRSLSLRKPVVVSCGTSVQKGIDKMLARHIGCILVVNDNQLAGIFTERDALLKIAGENLDLSNSKIDDFMTRDTIALHRSDSISAALRLMHEGRYRHVPIVDDLTKPLAVVSIRDIVRYIVEYFPQDVLNLPPHPIRIGTKNREGG